MSATFLPESRKLIEVVRNLRAAGFEPVLVGGLALTLFGSDRVTFDCDLLTARPADLDQAKSLVGAMHKAKCFFVSKLDKHRRPVQCIDNVAVAAARVLIDKPDTAFFWNQALEMRFDLLLDFPMKSDTLLAAAVEKKLGKSARVKVAGLKHLKLMKEIALRERKEAKDAQDLEFIKRNM